MKFEDIKIVEKVVTTKEIDVKTFLRETFGLTHKQCKFYGVVHLCTWCPCYRVETGCVMKYIYNRLD